tara:strand:+ start:23600 stop:23725 length:126 start_codon:yes stop_codon:yes gene_type:complete
MPGASKSYSILGRDFYRTPIGDNKYMGRTKRLLIIIQTQIK